MPLETDLLKSQEYISQADHIAIFYPTWWGTIPAKLKGFFDRILLPGYAFKFSESSPVQEKLLIGKTATIVTTMDTPIWYYKYVQGNLGVRLLKNLILKFCGIETKKVVYVGPVKNYKKSDIEAWLRKMNSI